MISLLSLKAQWADNGFVFGELTTTHMGKNAYVKSDLCLIEVKYSRANYLYSPQRAVQLRRNLHFSLIW